MQEDRCAVIRGRIKHGRRIRHYPRALATLSMPHRPAGVLMQGQPRVHSTIVVWEAEQIRDSDWRGLEETRVFVATQMPRRSLQGSRGNNMNCRGD